MFMVLGRGPQQSRPADIDILNGFLQAGLLPGNGFLEGVEVDADDLDRNDAVFLQFLVMACLVQPGQDSAVDLGVEGFHPAAQDLREARHLANALNRKARLFQHLLGSPGGQDLKTQALELSGQLHNAALVRNADQCSFGQESPSAS